MNGTWYTLAEGTDGYYTYALQVECTCQATGGSR